jgi:hypothetical protein
VDGIEGEVQEERFAAAFVFLDELDGVPADAIGLLGVVSLEELEAHMQKLSAKPA